MKSSGDRSITSALRPYRFFFGNIGRVALVLSLFSCSAIPRTQWVNPPVAAHALPPRYSMVFIIHGDGDYRYHDTSGRALKADEEALAGAAMVAVRNPQAEVFIFHEKPRKHTLLFFPRRDGKFYYYRQGQLLATESYWRDQGRSRFDSVVERYQRFSAGEAAQPVKLFFYFGHEIPEFDGAGYDASYSHRRFVVNDLAGGLKRITADAAKFDLIVLSTCFNGTPYTIAELAPYARTIVASPDNLHLSYFDLDSFERMDAGEYDGDMNAFAKVFARRAFERLTEEIQTAVTVAVYDVDRVQGYVNAAGSAYEHALAALRGEKPGSFAHCDCAEEAAYQLPGMSEGVEVFYRPAQFGPAKHKQSHSGWECWRLLK